MASSDSRSQFLKEAKTAREERAREKQRNDAAIKIQAFGRSYLKRKELANKVRSEFDTAFSEFNDLNKSAQLPTAKEGFRIARTFIFYYRDDQDSQRFLQLCRYLLCSLESHDAKTSCVALALTKDSILSWVRMMKKILWRTCVALKECKADHPTEAKVVNLYLHMLVSFTSCNTWGLLKSPKAEALKPSLSQLCVNILNDLVAKGLYDKIAVLMKKGLCRSKPTLKHTTLTAAFTMTLRPLINGSFAESLLSQFLIHILPIPALVYHLQSTAQECTALLLTHRIFERTVLFLTGEQTTKTVFNSLDGVDALSLLANLIHLGTLEKEVLVENLLDFTNTVTRIVEKSKGYVTNQKSQTTHWHKVLGWFSQPLDDRIQSSIPLVVIQLQMLWSADMVRCLFRDLVNVVPSEDASSPRSSNGAASQSKALAGPVKILLKKMLEKQNSNKALQRLGSPETTVVALVCLLYQSALSTFSQLRYEILSGLCYQDFLLPRLWHFISSMGSQNGLKAFLELLHHNPKASSPEFQILILFCDVATYLITILDDMELYEQQKPFKLSQLAEMAQFLNQMVFKIVWTGIVDPKSASTNQLFTSLHSYLMLLYHRDCRRSFVGSNANFWLIKEVKPSNFLSELEKGNKKSLLLIHKVPHIIPHRERVILFRKYVRMEKEALGLVRESDVPDVSSTLITVHRPRIVEDGYRQLSLLPVRSLKGVIRVRFVNDQGLDEAGIDQDGVFKEFLEETIKKVFDPSLSLFKITSDGRLYPSASSGIHENHLALFDFVGRMLGKAVYEGIVVEVPFASFFLTQILGKSTGLGYSALDELPSLDAELYKSLTYVKHYEGDISELELTFSCDEDNMGQLETHDLVPGGRTIPVTNQNKISYIHHMAHFRMYKQIKNQVTAFVRGFRAIIAPEWLMLFSTGELQKLISGGTEDFDLNDLRRHTKYYGGFHNSHRLIVWLWEVVEKDFTPEERRLFLKFVTSCSKPPLLGFAHLEPAFSIRCVEVGDDQDQGDTLGSVIRGFLAIRKKEPTGRLPTSSTCFNLLKLPNYQKKSTLKEKLKYAIHSGTGFELS